MRSRTLATGSIVVAVSLAVAACDAGVGDVDDEELAEEVEEGGNGGGDGDQEDTEEPQIDEGEGADPDATQIDWATSDVGSAGHTALVNLSALLNREWDGYETNVLPTGGALQSVIGFATNEFDAYYGADIAFAEASENRDRYEGFSDDAERELVQSFWAYPMETGLAIHADNAEQFQSWSDLSGEPVFTSPAPWDVRANLESAMDAAGVGHEYVEVDTGVAGNSLDTGDISAMVAYTTSESNPAPWVAEAELQTDMQILNPSDDEVQAIEDAGHEVVSVDPANFESDDLGVEEALFVPFFYGFHVGTNISADDVYAMLDVVAEHADELADADPAYQVLADDPAELQRRGVESSIEDAAVHPGMAQWMRDQGVWDDAWDDRVAQQ